MFDDSSLEGYNETWAYLPPEYDFDDVQEELEDESNIDTSPLHAKEGGYRLGIQGENFNLVLANRRPSFIEKVLSGGSAKKYQIEYQEGKIDKHVIETLKSYVDINDN